MSIIGTQKVGHQNIIPDSGYTEKIYTLTVRIIGTKEKDIHVVRKVLEDDLLNKHIDAGDAQLITATLEEV